jgi:hypothetical protein
MVGPSSDARRRLQPFPPQDASRESAHRNEAAGKQHPNETAGAPF